MAGEEPDNWLQVGHTKKPRLILDATKHSVLRVHSQLNQDTRMLWTVAGLHQLHALPSLLVHGMQRLTTPSNPREGEAAQRTSLLWTKCRMGLEGLQSRLCGRSVCPFQYTNGPICTCSYKTQNAML